VSFCGFAHDLLAPAWPHDVGRCGRRSCRSRRRATTRLGHTRLRVARTSSLGARLPDLSSFGGGACPAGHIILKR